MDNRLTTEEYWAAHKFEPVITRKDRQPVVADWGVRAFGAEQTNSIPHRGLRFLEESDEAAQAAGVTRELAHQMVDYVWNRPVGELAQELGGVGICVLALAQAAGLDADKCEVDELNRVLAKPIEHFTKRNQAKNDAGFHFLGVPPDWTQCEICGFQYDKKVYAFGCPCLRKQKSQIEVRKLYPNAIEEGGHIWSNAVAKMGDTAVFLGASWDEAAKRLKEQDAIDIRKQPGIVTTRYMTFSEARELSEKIDGSIRRAEAASEIERRVLRLWDKADGTADYAESEWMELQLHVRTFLTREKDLLALIEQWKTWGIVEIAVRNTNAKSYMDHWESRATKAEAEVDRLKKLINTPQTADFFDSVSIEAAHQQERWGTINDAGKEDSDWFWLIGYLAGKILRPDVTPEKRLHHIITTAAVCLNWHRHATGEVTEMRPGIEEPK